LFYSTFVSCATTHSMGDSFQVTTIIKGCTLSDGLLFLFINILMNLFAVEQFLTSAKVVWFAISREGTIGNARF